MVPVITFIGWHNSGKTTLACQVVRYLNARGYRIAVIKSTKECGLMRDSKDSDTWKYHRAGADPVALVAPDQMTIRSSAPVKDLSFLAQHYFPDMDLVIGEGFKEDEHVPKIEVSRGTGPLLRDRVNNVIAIATDRKITGKRVFRLDRIGTLAKFIEEQIIRRETSREEVFQILLDGVRVEPEQRIRKLIADTLRQLADITGQPEENMKVELRLSSGPARKRAESGAADPGFQADSAE